MSVNTIRIVAGIFLIAHGLVHFSLTYVPTPQPGAMRTPFWPSLARKDVDPAWLAKRTGLPEPAARTLGALLCILATACFVLAGLGLLGVPLLSGAWPILAAAAAVLSLVLHLFYWHPWLVAGVVIDLAVLAGVVLKIPGSLFPGE